MYPVINPESKNPTFSSQNSSVRVGVTPAWSSGNVPTTDAKNFFINNYNDNFHNISVNNNNLLPSTPPPFSSPLSSSSLAAATTQQSRTGPDFRGMGNQLYTPDFGSNYSNDNSGDGGSNPFMNDNYREVA